MTIEITSPLDLKQLVLIVTSPHLETVRNEQEANATLEHLDNTTYVRNLVISLASQLYSPVNVYIDGITEEYCDVYANPLLDVITEEHRLMVSLARSERSRQRYGKVPSEQQEYPPIQLRHPSPERMRDILFRVGNGFNDYRFSIDDLHETVAIFGDAPRHGISLDNYDMERLVMMLGIPAFHGAQITIRPGEYDLELISKALEAVQRKQRSAIQSTIRQRDQNLYQHVVEDLKEGKTNAIVYFGPAHEMTQLRRTNQFDVAFVDVRRNEGGVVEVKGILPSLPPNEMKHLELKGYDMEKLVTGYLQDSGPIKVMLNLHYRPRQLM